MNGWRPVDEEETARLEAELSRELVAGHPLFGRMARAEARRDDCDDVAFLVDDGVRYIVHLTWADAPEAGWPAFERLDVLPEDEG